MLLNQRYSWILLLALVLALLALTTPETIVQSGVAQRASSNSTVSQITTDDDYVSEPVVPNYAPPVSTLPPFKPEVHLDREINPRLNLNTNLVEQEEIDQGPDPLLPIQANAPEATAFPFLTPILNFNGQGFTGVNPPDTVGEVGPNHYIQMINSGGGTNVRIYDKSGAVLSNFALDSLGSNQCANGLGDPIVLYDRQVDRWFLSEFSNSGNRLCVYISDGPDPVNDGWHTYIFQATNFPDYPKYGVWNDAYYVGTNENVPTVYAFERDEMLNGNPATMIRRTASSLSGFGFQMITPADHDGATAVPANEPGIFMRHRDKDVHGNGSCTGGGSVDCLEIWEFDVNWANPNSSTFALAETINVADFDSSLCGLTSFSCIDQPGGGQDLDPLREVIMNRLQYRNMGSYEVLVGNYAVDVGGDDAGIRWFELRRTGGNWSLFQEGTYAPDSTSRWMGAISMDSAGNIALAYNVSDASSTFPGLRYVGRLAGDPAGTMPQGEATIVNGTARNSSNRYGDYAAMGVDPADDCTFWFTGQFNTSGNWSTRIASFKFDQCGSPDFSIGTTPASVSVCAGLDAVYTVNVGSIGGFNNPVTLSTSGLPAGASAGFSPNPVVPVGSSTLTVDTAGVATGNYTFDVTGTAGPTNHSTSVGLDVEANAPSAPSLSAPANGATGVSTMPTLNWNAAPNATSYDVEVATDAGFGTIVYTANDVAGTSHVVSSPLAGATTYYWRVIAENGCGSAVSSTWSFETVAFFCSSPNAPIPDNNAGGVSDTISIGSTGTIDDINISLEVTHTWVGDLAVMVEHVDTGTTVTLFDRPGVPGNQFGCEDDDIDGVADDEGAIGNVENHCAGTTPWVGTSFVPTQSLSAFDGEDLSGDWEITIADRAGGDTGTLNTWCVIPELDQTPPTAVELQMADAGANWHFVGWIMFVALVMMTSIVLMKPRETH